MTVTSLLECRQLGPVGTTPNHDGAPLICTRPLGHEGLHAARWGNEAGFLAWSADGDPE